MNSKLTKREQQILGLIALGKTNKEIAQTLSIKESTVENHLHSIYRKLLVTNRAQAIVYAIKNGLVMSKNITDKNS